MDYSIKFWDIRRLTNPIDGIYDNTHWVWSTKYNKTFSRLMVTCSSSSLVRAVVFDKVEEHSDVHSYTSIDYVEFDDSVYAMDWNYNDPWTFAAVSYNSYLHINAIPEDIKYKIMLDN
jgi:hypothetical protein